MTEENAVVVFMTAANRAEAERIAELLVEKKLAACVQILPEITSFYHWQGKIARDSETLILAKTVAADFAELELTVRANHSYEVPEILAIPASAVSVPYFDWLKENTK